MAIPLERFSPWRRDNRISFHTNGKEVPQPEEKQIHSSEPILPFSIRFALEHRQGILNKSDLKSLTSSHFTDASIYLVTKSLDTNQEQQKDFLNSFINISRENASLHNYESLLMDTIDKLPLDTTVAGGKLAQISRQGFSNWEEKFNTLADEVYSPDTPHTPVMLAYASMLGFRQLVEAGVKSNKSLLILSPNWINNDVEENCGYQVNFGADNENYVQMLPKTFTRPDTTVLIDDTRKTGKHIEAIADFWNINTAKQISSENSRVICEVTPRSRPQPIPIFSAI